MPTRLTEFKDRLEIPVTLAPARVDPDGTCHYRISIRRGERVVHSELPGKTPYWGYEGLFPGPTLEVPKASKVVVEFVNDLPTIRTGEDPRSQWPFAIEPDAPADPVPMHVFVPPQPWTVVHLHGSPSAPDSDGWPDNAYFPGGSQTHHYPAQENAALLWYHDHANMVTRLNVYAGLAGLYLVRDAEAEIAQGYPVGEAAGEIPLLIQDRQLEEQDGAYTGRFAYHKLGSMDSFRGDYRLANGKITPFTDVHPRRYRLRIINGSNARILRLKLRPAGAAPTTVGMTVIGVDGGLLRTAVPTPTTTPPDDPTAPEQVLVLAPAERIDVLVDFDQYTGKDVDLIDHDPFDETMTRSVVRFVVAAGTPTVPGPVPALPERYRSRRSPGGAAAAGPGPPPAVRPIGLYQHVIMGEPMHTLNGRLFHDAPEEAPAIDTEEVWEILNLTGEEHPIHLHLVNFDILDRRLIKITDPDKPGYRRRFDGTFRAWRAAAAPRPSLPPGLDWNGDLVPADAYEKMFKDTVRVPSMSVTRIQARFRLRTGQYMYHCHILEHEDMEMMRPLLVVPRGLHLMTTPFPHHPPGGHGHDGHGGHH